MRSIFKFGVMLGAVLLCKSAVADTITTTTTTQKTQTTTGLSDVEPAPDARSLVIIESKPAPSSSLMSVKKLELTGNEDYAERLSAMRDQIRMGLEKDWLSQAQADQLLDEQSDLVAMEHRIRDLGYPKSDSDALEKRMNVFNVELSNQLSDGMRTAGAGIIQ